MAKITLLSILLFVPALATAKFPFFRRSNVPPEGYFNPLDKGGSMLTSVPNTFPAGLGEPMNAIITGNSDSDVLKDQEVDGGLRNYFLSFGFSSECLGQHAGDDQAADLGDGHGYLNESAVIRWNYGDPELGSCKESIEGGNHFRYWVQNGKEAQSGAVFMAVSYEKPISGLCSKADNSGMKLTCSLLLLLFLIEFHDIVINGYNLGRDWLVGNVTNQTMLIDSAQLTNTTTFSGQSTFKNYTYQTDVVYTPGLLSNTSDGINHHLSVGVNGSNAIDGLVAVMTVKIVSRPPVSASSRASPTLPLLSLSSIVALVMFVTSLFSLSL
ncbi:hypothetical protein NLI96_g5512 [Meripilus lineatus]|uniref:Uncharacterized protein n=1 Tax=Meripilus lineatus TaxID=2056292 RepID=A0AAD5YIX8_9APHY|nr:hypothetical protein NLI96_g5512 [Physisporinus lineatus]